MKKYRILSLLLTAAIPFSMFGCAEDAGNGLKPTRSSAEKSDTESAGSEFYDKYSPVELDTVKEHITQLQEDAETSGNSEKLQEDIDTLLSDLDAVYESLSYITLAYYTDWNNDKLEAEYDKCYENFYVAYELLSYAFANGYKKEEYSSIFEPYVNMEYLDYYTDRAMSIKRLEGYCRVDYEVMDEYLDDYYEIAYDRTLNENLKNLEAAEIYLDLLSSYDTETFYESYDRDFSADQIIELSKIVRSELIPISEKLEEIFADSDKYSDVYDNAVVFDNPFEAIEQYAAEISPEIEESAAFLNENKLYALAEGDNCYTGSFTDDLPLENSALIYIYNYGDSYDFLTAVHEFGHFYASFYDDTTAYLMENNIDIAEIQSQGMETLFMPLYDEIYGEQAEAMRLLKLYDLLDSVISGFIIGEFEYTVLSNLDTMTPQDVVDYFDSLMAEYNYDADLYYISHLFEQPGYYISYGVSALAALDIWETSLDDYGKALEMYENIAQVKVNSGEFQFNSALEHCGFNDVLNENYIKELGTKISNYAESLV